MSALQKRLFRTLLAVFIFLFAVMLGMFTFFQIKTSSLDAELRYKDSLTWQTYALGCFIIQVPEDKSVVRILTGDDFSHFEIVPRIKNDSDWQAFLKRSHDVGGTVYINIGSYLRHFSPPLSGKPIVIGGLKGYSVEKEDGDQLSGGIQLWAPFPYKNGKIDIRVHYHSVPQEKRVDVDEMIKTIRFDTSTYLDGYYQASTPQITWLDGPPSKVDPGPFDLAFEQAPIHNVRIQHQFLWPWRDMACLSTGLWVKSRRIGELIEQ